MSEALSIPVPVLPVVVGEGGEGLIGKGIVPRDAFRGNLPAKGVEHEAGGVQLLVGPGIAVIDAP